MGTPASARERGLSAIGYYRSHLRDGLHLSAEDLSLIKEHFSSPSSVFLVVRPSELGPPVAGFFFWDVGEVNAEFTFLDFPFDARLLTEVPRRPESGSAPPAALPAPASPGAELARLPAPEIRVAAPETPATLAQPRSVPLVPAAARLTTPLAILGAAAILAAGLVGYRLLQRGSGPLTSSSGAPVRLQVERNGTDLRVVWDRRSPAFGEARVGILSVTDGVATREIHLDPGQLRDGWVMYSPATDKIRFRLEVFGAS
ncbi:MAG: hypothetical protein FJX77_15325, partial [Armatimonadetes bacterium]|nr:hypothetical protein [Armatimonadota bacterium]